MPIVEIHRLYDGKVNLGFDTVKHMYSINEEQVPSVTGIVNVLNKPALIWWAARMAAEYVIQNITAGEPLDELQIIELAEGAKLAHKKTATRAASIGTLAHDWIRQWIIEPSTPPPINEQAKNACESFIEWVEERRPIFHFSERKVYSKKHNYAGTTDFVCEIDGEMYVGDIKTSDSIYDEYILQIAGYMIALKEEFPNAKYENYLIVRCGKDGTLEVHENKITKHDIAAFLAALELYRWQQKQKKTKEGAKNERK